MNNPYPTPKTTNSPKATNPAQTQKLSTPKINESSKPTSKALATTGIKAATNKILQKQIPKHAIKVAPVPIKTSDRKSVV